MELISLASVVLPAHKGCSFLRETIDDVLAQMFLDFQYLVIDDGSTDGAVSALCAIAISRLEIQRNPRNLGLITTLNQGLGLARTPLFSRMNAGDVTQQHRLERQLAAFAADPALNVIGTWTQTAEVGRPVATDLQATPAGARGVDTVR